MTRRKLTLTSFPEEFFILWRQAVANSLHIDFETKGMGTNFKQRMYQFRKFLHEEGNPEGAAFYKIDLVVRENEDKTAYLEAFLPPWKIQAREAAQGFQTQPQTPEATVVEPNALEEALTRLGFGTKES